VTAATLPLRYPARWRPLAAVLTAALAAVSLAVPTPTSAVAAPAVTATAADEILTGTATPPGTTFTSRVRPTAGPGKG